MIPPNTVPITAEELNYIQRTPEAKFFVWCFVDAKRWVAEDTDNPYLYCRNDVKEMRIAAHDYRHYFGEVVDLKEHVTGSVLQYMGDAFILTRDDEPNYYTLYECIDNGYPDRLILTDLESQCKKIVIDHFTALFKKDLPHLNIKFIWS